MHSDSVASRGRQRLLYKLINLCFVTHLISSRCWCSWFAKSAPSVLLHYTLFSLFRLSGYVSAEEGSWGPACQHRPWSVLPGSAETSHQHTPLLPRPRPASYRKVDGSRADKGSDKLPYRSVNFNTAHVPFWGTLFLFISNGSSCFPAFSQLIPLFFFSIRSMR